MKPLPEMSAVELRAELDAAIEAEKGAEWQERLADWYECRKAAQARQNAVVVEMARRRAHWSAVSGMRVLAQDNSAPEAGADV
jgi:hypothetical protein